MQSEDTVKLTLHRFFTQAKQKLNYLCISTVLQTNCQ
jgi:hypothetical protein